MQKFGLNSPGSIYRYIKTLEKKGVLTTEKQGHRSILPLVEKDEFISKNALEVEIPFIGNLSIGYPLEIYEKPQMIAAPSFMVHSPEETYALQIQGDTLKDEGIFDGDLILIEAREEIHPGEIALGLINHKDTFLRRYFPEGQNIRLESESKEHPPLTVRAEHVTVQGVLIGLLRIY